MGVDQKRGGRSVRKTDLEASGVEAIKRDTNGNIQHANVDTKSGTTVKTTAFTTTVQATRAFASNQALTVNTTGTAGGGGVTLNGPAGNTATTTIGTANTTSTSAEFSEQVPATWTLSASVTTGTLTITSWTVSKEDTRG